MTHCNYFSKQNHSAFKNCQYNSTNCQCMKKVSEIFATEKRRKIKKEYI
jgi:hypothetical protein